MGRRRGSQNEIGLLNLRPLATPSIQVPSVFRSYGKLDGRTARPALDPAQAPVLAEITGFCVVSTGVVATVKPVLLWPAGTVTCAGTLAEDEELDKLTGCPPAGAGVVSATLPLTLFPPITSDRERFTLPTQADEDGDVDEEGLTVTVADCVFAELALIVAVVGDDTVDVETWKLALVCPAGIVTEAGTITAELLLASPAWMPPAGAADASVTVPVAVCPLVTFDGETATLAIVAVAVWGGVGFPPASGSI